MAFTSGTGLEYAFTNDYHNIELQYDGSVLTMTLYDQPEIKGVSEKRG